MLIESSPWRRAKGLTLFSFMDLSASEFEKKITIARISGTWVETSRAYLVSNVRRNEFAKQWFETFLEATDRDRRYAARLVFRHLVDERFWYWRGRLEQPAPQYGVARRFIRQQKETLRNEFRKQSTERKRNLFGQRIEKDLLASTA